MGFFMNEGVAFQPLSIGHKICIAFPVLVMDLHYFILILTHSSSSKDKYMQEGR